MRAGRRRVVSTAGDGLVGRVVEDGVSWAAVSPERPLDRAAIPLYDSAKRPSPVVEELVELWRYRDLVVQLVHRDIVARYKRSFLGVAWTMLNPLATMLVLAVVFSQAFGARPAYAAYVLCGLLAWNFFAQTTLSAMRQLLWGAGLLHRRRPRSITMLETASPDA
jgi:hypothetical protein